MTVPIITLDGPSGTGKGTLCYKLAQHLGWHALDSGSIYRTLAYAAHLKGLTADDINCIVKLAQHFPLHYKLYAEGIETWLDNKNITTIIRSEHCARQASVISAIPEIRQALLERQRSFAAMPGLVTDGRDMGTVVFPKAAFKFYLDASLEVRATRRHLQLQAINIKTSLSTITEELMMRDERDKHRLHAPLKPAEDAIIIETTGLSIVQVFDNILSLVGKHRCISNA